MQKRILEVIFFILMLNLVSAYGYSIGNIFDQIGGDNLILIIIFIASFAFINWLLSRSIKENKSVAVILSLCSAVLITYGSYRSDLAYSISNFFSGFYFSNPFSNFYFPDFFSFDFSADFSAFLLLVIPILLLIGFVCLIFRKWKTAFIFFAISSLLILILYQPSNFNIYLLLSIGLVIFLIVVGILIYFFKKFTKGYHLSKIYKKLHKI